MKWQAWLVLFWLFLVAAVCLIVWRTRFRVYFMVGKTVWAFWGAASSSRQRLVMVLRSVKNEIPCNVKDRPLE